MNTVQKSSVSLDGHGSWLENGQAGSYTFTADEVIEAFHHGEKSGEKKLIDELRAAMLANTHKAMDLCEDIWVYLSKNGFSPVGMRLRRDGFSSFTGLFLVNEEKYFSGDFDQVYDYKFELLDHVNTSEYHLATNFIPYNGVFNDDLAISDGFVFSYVKS
jgi:hypothetical protein